MSEAKTYDTKLKNYRETVEQYHRSSNIQRSKTASGIEIVNNEINQLNGQYQALMEKILDVLNQLQDDADKLSEFVSFTIKFSLFLLKFFLIQIFFIKFLLFFFSPPHPFSHPLF